MSEWQPIETAPKDGTSILAIVADRPGSMLEYQTGRLFVIRHEGMLSDFDMGWAVYPGFGGCSDHAFSHWCALPTPPADKP